MRYEQCVSCKLKWNVSKFHVQKKYECPTCTIRKMLRKKAINNEE